MGGHQRKTHTWDDFKEGESSVGPAAGDVTALSELEEKILRMRYGLTDATEAPLSSSKRTNSQTGADLAKLERHLRDAAGRVPGLPFHPRNQPRKPRS